jgi:hypothetical protein
MAARHTAPDRSRSPSYLIKGIVSRPERQAFERPRLLPLNDECPINAALIAALVTRAGNTNLGTRYPPPEPHDLRAPEDALADQAAAPNGGGSRVAHGNVP